MEKKKTVLLGVSGGIAAYKSASLASMLIKDGYDVEVLMTKNAENFINPIVFETLTGHKCLVDTFDRNFEFKVEHVAVAKKADAVIIAPATANIIAKLAHGIADDMLTTTVLACRTCPKLIAPAMNTEMYLNPVVQDNLEILRKYGWHVIEPAEGHLACGDTGAGKMPEIDILYDYLEKALAPKDLTGLNGMVQAHELLHDHAPCTDVEVTDLGVAHLACRQADSLAGSLDGRPRILRHEGVEIGRGGEAHGICLAGCSPSQAVHNDEEGGEPIHAAPPSRCR